MVTKYVIYEFFPYTFPGQVNHRLFADNLNMIRRRIESAGFVALLPDGSFHCFGESESLGIKSRPEDSEIFNRMFKPREVPL